MVCGKCGSELIEMKRDARGLPNAYCATCGSLIKKMSTSEVIEYYEQRLKMVRGVGDDDRQPCPYCTERWIMLRGNERTRVIQVPVDIQYCPVCGRKLKESDRAY